MVYIRDVPHVRDGFAVQTAPFTAPLKTKKHFDMTVNTKVNKH